jgi:hypothetical protein
MTYSKRALATFLPAAWIIASAIPLGAQTPTTPTPATCTTAPASLTALNIERKLPLTDVLTTLTLNIPATMLASLTGGAQEVHEILIYNPQLGTVTSTVFVVAAGAPIPTPNFDFQTGVIQTTTIKISQTLTSCSPSPSIVLVGTVSNSSATGAIGNVTGAPAVVSIGYTTDTPPQMNNVVEVIGGVVTAWSAAASGTITFPAVSVVPPGSTGAITVVVTSPGLGALKSGSIVPIQVVQNPILLDASTSTGTGPLTFAWTSLGQPVSFNGTPTPGQILVSFPTKGDYTVMLTVTDTNTGQTSTFSVIFEFTG